MAGDGGTRAVVAALLANTGIAITKFVAFLLARNSSMLAEAIHSCADAGNQVLLLLGGKRAKREATPEHPFGFGRERYIYSFMVSIVLFSVGGLFALYEAYHKFHEIHAGHVEEVGRLEVLGAGRRAAGRDRDGVASRSGPRSWRPTRSGAHASFAQFIRRAKSARAAR